MSQMLAMTKMLGNEVLGPAPVTDRSLSTLPDKSAKVVAYMVMAYIGLAHSYGVYRYGVYSYCVYSYGLYY